MDTTQSGANGNPAEADQKRCRRCALPPQSKWLSAPWLLPLTLPFLAVFVEYRQFRFRAAVAGHLHAAGQDFRLIDLTAAPAQGAATLAPQPSAAT